MRTGIPAIKLTRVVCAFVIVLAVFGAYQGVARFGLVNMDDIEYLVGASSVPKCLTVEGLVWAWRSLEHSIWMPLTWFSYMIDFTAGWGYGGMHVHSVALHALNAVLVFLLLSRTVRYAAPERTEGVFSVALPALAGALVWAIHPLRVESVVWLASRKDVLSFLFEALALVLWLGAGRHREDSPRFWTAYLLALLCFAAGAMAKPSVMTFPLLALAIDAFVVRRIRPRMYAVPAAMMAIVAVEAAYAQTAGGATGDLGGVPLWWRILNAMSAFGVYAANTVCPTDLAVQCLCRYPELPRGALQGVILSCATGAYVLVRLAGLWRRRGDLFVRSDESGAMEYQYVGDCDFAFAGLLWCCIGIGPFLGIANFGYHAFADRFTYIPAVGMSLALMGLVRTGAGAGRCGLSLALACALPLGILTARQVATWRDETSVWRQTLKVDGDRNAVAHQGLGYALFEIDHDLEGAVREFRRVRELSERVYENCAEGHVFASCEAGRLDEAAEALEWFRLYARRYSVQGARQSRNQFGDVETIYPSLTNYEYARIAFRLCDAKTRADARRDLERLTMASGMSKVIAYLWYRMGEESGDEQLRRSALEHLAEAEPTDFLQFSYLTNKEVGK